MNTYTFRPRPWAVLLTLLLAGGMVTAGVWQYHRGIQKQAMQAARVASSTAVAAAFLDDVTTPPRGRARQVRMEGEYLTSSTVLLDNQPHQGNPGVHVWTPLRLADGQIVVIDRGWLPLGSAPTDPPAGAQQLTGQWKQLPEPGMRLGAPATICESPRPLRVTYPELLQVRCLFGERTLAGVLELDATLPGGFMRDWAAAGVNEIPPSRHFAYAAQWGLFALTLVALFIKINLKKRPSHG